MYHTYFTHYKELECLLSVYEPLFLNFGVDVVLRRGARKRNISWKFESAAFHGDEPLFLNYGVDAVLRRGARTRNISRKFESAAFHGDEPPLLDFGVDAVLRRGDAVSALRFGAPGAAGNPSFEMRFWCGSSPPNSFCGEFFLCVGSLGNPLFFCVL